MAAGKHHALAIGILAMSGAEMYRVSCAHARTHPRSIAVNQGPGVESAHYLNDGLWRMIMTTTTTTTTTAAPPLIAAARPPITAPQ